MDLHYLENIICIAEERSITKAAEKRFVTQSALSQQLQKLEEELGTPLFYRTRSNWQLTEAGEVYLEAARKMLLMKRDVYGRIADVAEKSHRHLSIGLIPERGVEMFTSIYPAFHKSFPDVRTEPHECSVRDMQKGISAGTLDLGLATLREEQKDDNEYHLLCEEEIVLAVPADHPLAEGGAVWPGQAPETDIGRFADVPFIRIYQKSTLFELTEQIFRHAGFVPKELFSTSSSISKYRIVEAGLGCALLPESYARTCGKVLYFSLPDHPRWQITLCSRRDAYLGRPEQMLIKLCRSYWEVKIRRPDAFGDA